jgi:hypothetical protein
LIRHEPSRSEKDDLNKYIKQTFQSFKEKLRAVFYSKRSTAQPAAISNPAVVYASIHAPEKSMPKITEILRCAKLKVMTL